MERPYEPYFTPGCLLYKTKIFQEARDRKTAEVFFCSDESKQRSAKDVKLDWVAAAVAARSAAAVRAELAQRAVF